MAKAEPHYYAFDAQMLEPRGVTERYQQDCYQVTGNHFQGALNTWRNFARKSNPENRDFTNHVKMDEKRAVDVVIKEINDYGSLISVSTKKSIFQREGERGQNGEITTERMTHFFKGAPFIVTKTTKRSEVVEKYRKTMDDMPKPNGIRSMG